MRKVFVLLLSLFMCCAVLLDCVCCAEAANKPLIIYFTYSGNSRILADYVKKFTGGDLFEGVPAQPYPGDYHATTRQARKELEAGVRPKLKADKIPNLAVYDTVVLVHPNWWGTIPTPVMTLLEANDFSGKKIAQLVTHEGSGVGGSSDDLKKLCPKSTLLDPEEVRGGSVRDAEKKVGDWLKKVLK